MTIQFIITEDELDTLDNMDQTDFVRDMLERIRERKRTDNEPHELHNGLSYG